MLAVKKIQMNGINLKYFIVAILILENYPF